VRKVKNFPHQYNDLAKLRATLETVRDLEEQGLDSTDDAVLGYELARRMVYGFRNLDESGGEAESRTGAEPFGPELASIGPLETALLTDHHELTMLQRRQDSPDQHC
jgi:hypothetical protein